MNTSPAVRVSTTTTAGFASTMAGFLAIVAAIFIVVGISTATFAEVSTSAWQTAGAGAIKYFPLAIGIMMTPVLLPVYVAQGVTRRQVAGGLGLFIITWSVILTLAMVVGYAIEAGVYAAMEWPHGFDTPHLFGSWTEVHLIIAEYFPLIAVHMMAGWLIGTTYYVLRWFRATLLLPVSVLPILIVEGLLGTSWIGAGLESVPAYTPPHPALAVPLAIAVVAATWAVNYVLIRELPIKLGSS